MRLSYAMVFVSDMARSVRFYRDTIGLSLRFESPEWTEFETGGATFALHKAEDSDPIGGQPAAGTCRPGFAVACLAEFHERMSRLGVNCVQAPQKVFGVNIAQYLDPDNVVIAVSESEKSH